MYCKNCGTQIPDDALFCPACGNKTANFPQENAAEPPVTEDVMPAEEITEAPAAAMSIENELDAILDRSGIAEASAEPEGPAVSAQENTPEVQSPPPQVTEPIFA